MLHFVIDSMFSVKVHLFSFFTAVKNSLLCCILMFDLIFGNGV